MAERYFPIHKIPTLRNALATDELEVQAQNGGPSARVPAASINFGGPTGPAGPSICPTPYDFGAVGDGTTDDYVALQDWFNAIAGGTGYLKSKNLSEVQAGQFLTNTTLIVKSNTCIFGDGGSVSQFWAGPDLSPSSPLMRNESLDINNPDRDIIFRDVGFNGKSDVYLGYPVSTLQVSHYIASGGTGYVLDETFTVDGGDQNCIGKVTYLVGGVVQDEPVDPFTPGVTIVGAGTNYHTAGHVTTSLGGTSPGSGTGLKVRLAADRSEAFLMYFYVVDALFQNCLFEHIGYINFYMTLTQNCRFFGNTFTSVGDSIDLSGALNTKIIGNSFRDNGSACVSISGGPGTPSMYTVIQGNNFNNIGEVFIYSSSAAVQTLIDGNVFHTSYFSWDNAVGLELAGSNITVSNNAIMYTGWNCITFFNCLGVNLVNNQFFYPGQTTDPLEPGDDPSCCVMFYIEQPSSIGKDIIVTGNQCVASDSGVVDGIRFRSFAGGTTPFQNVLVANNQTAGSIWRVGGVVVDDFPLTTTSVWDQTCRRKDNWGTVDCDPYTVHVLLPETTNGDFVITGLPYRPRTCRIVGVVAVSTYILQSIGEVNSDLSAVSNSIGGNLDGGGVAQFNTATGDTGTAGFALNIVDGEGNAACNANVTAFGATDLTLTSYFPTTAPVWLTVTVYP